MLSILLVRANNVVAVEEFVDELWPRRPPVDARALVHGYVSRLRRALRQQLDDAAAARLVTRKPGYLLRVQDDELDVHRYGRLVAAARAHPPGGSGGLRLALLDRAHAEWRGPALQDAPPTAVVTAARVRLTEDRLVGLQARFDAALALGQGPELVVELTELVAAYPLREHLVRQLMLSLHRSGRSADALAVYRDIRRRLTNELGIDPGAGLRDLEVMILRGTDRPLAPAYVVPAQLPADAGGFVGRRALLRALDTGLGDVTGATDGASRCVVLAGPAGIGKTAVAVHWAHRVRDQFPDGQLYVNLQGYSAAPLRPGEILARFTRALGVPGERLPPDPDEAAALYRTLLYNRQVLVLLDNVRDEKQVRPLLPGGPGCCTVVTSRHRLEGLVAREGAALAVVDVLDTNEALRLLVDRLGPERTRREPRPVLERLVERCGRMPLALRMVGAHLLCRPDQGASDYLAELDRSDSLTC